MGLRPGSLDKKDEIHRDFFFEGGVLPGSRTESFIYAKFDGNGSKHLDIVKWTITKDSMDGHVGKNRNNNSRCDPFLTSDEKGDDNSTEREIGEPNNNWSSHHWISNLFDCIISDENEIISRSHRLIGKESFNDKLLLGIKGYGLNQTFDGAIIKMDAGVSTESSF